MKAKKIIAIITLCTVISSFLGCTSKSNSKDNTSSTNQSNIEKPKVINALFDSILTPNQGQAKVVDEYKKRTGIDLKITQPAHNQYYEKVNLAFASGEIPDVLEISGASLVKYAYNNALYDITNLVNNSTVLKDVDKKYTDSVKVNGKIYGYPLYAGGGAVTYMRKDWLDANNLKVPTNYDEYINVLKVFSDDPDKNGKKDTIGVTASGVISSDPTTPPDVYLREFYQDATPDFIKKDGKWIDGMTQPEMKAALQRLRQAYSDGLIDKEIFTNQTSTCRDKWGTGIVGSFTYWAGMWNTRLNASLKKSVNTSSVVAIPAIKETKYLERPPITTAITSKAKNPEGIFKYFIEYMHDGKDGEMLFSRGVENVHYKVENGKYSALPALDDPKQTADKAFFDPLLSITKFKDPVPHDEAATKSLDVLNKNSKMAYLLPASDAYTKNSTNLMTSKVQILSKAVLGEITVDEAFQKYTDNNKAAIKAILDDLNKSK